MPLRPLPSLLRTFSQTTPLKMPPTSSTARPIVFCGPSGAGKSTIIEKLRAQYPGKFEFSISHTTRSPRGKEQNGLQYHFVSKAEFEKMIGEDGFIEHAYHNANHYGTSKAAIKDVAATGKICILDIDTEGVRQIKKTDLGARCLFLSPPSLEILEQRLRGRQTDKEEDIQKRLGKVAAEMEFGREPGVFDKVVVNDDLDRAYAEVREWVVDGGDFEQST